MLSEISEKIIGIHWRGGYLAAAGSDVKTRDRKTIFFVDKTLGVLLLYQLALDGYAFEQVKIRVKPRLFPGARFGDLLEFLRGGVALLALGAETMLGYLAFFIYDHNAVFQTLALFLQKIFQFFRKLFGISGITAEFFFDLGGDHHERSPISAEMIGDIVGRFGTLAERIGKLILKFAARRAYVGQRRRRSLRNVSDIKFHKSTSLNRTAEKPMADIMII